MKKQVTKKPDRVKSLPVVCFQVKITEKPASPKHFKQNLYAQSWLLGLAGGRD